MPVSRVHKKSQPLNSILTDASYGNYTITVNETYDCGNVVQNFVLDSSLTGLTSGKYVLVKAQTGISNYVGATVTCNVSGRTVVGVSNEPVNFSGTTYQCIVVTLE